MGGTWGPCSTPPPPDPVFEILCTIADEHGKRIVPVGGPAYSSEDRAYAVAAALDSRSPETAPHYVERSDHCFA